MRVLFAVLTVLGFLGFSSTAEVTQPVLVEYADGGGNYNSGGG